MFVLTSSNCSQFSLCSLQQVTLPWLQRKIAVFSWAGGGREQINPKEHEAYGNGNDCFLNEKAEANASLQSE